jgi:hypothetical protein
MSTSSQAPAVTQSHASRPAAMRIRSGVRVLSGCFLLLAGLIGLRTDAMASGAATLYISPLGNDSWSGRVPDPSASDGPLRSIARARDSIRQLKAAGGLKGPIRVQLRGGYYALDQAVKFDYRDSGSADSPITYEAYPGETPILSGGVRISNWKRLSGIPAGAPSQVGGLIWAAEIPKGWRFNELFVNGARLHRASIPPADHWEGWYQSSAGLGGKSFAFAPGTVQPPLDLKNLEVDFLTPGRAANLLFPAAAIDAASGRIDLMRAGPFPMWKGMPFRLENTPAGLLQPADWYVDSTSGKVYCYPPRGFDLNRSQTIAPRLSEALEIRGDDKTPGHLVQFLTLRGLTLEYFDRTREDQPPPPLGHGFFTSNDTAIFLTGVQDCTIERCNISRVGGVGIRAILYSRRLRLLNNEIADCGAQAIAFTGYGPGRYFVNGEHLISGNHIHHTGKTYYNGSGISLASVGNSVIANNHIHHMAAAGVSLTGISAKTLRASRANAGVRWNEIGADPLTAASSRQFIPGHITVENNLVHDVMELINDGGGIASWAGQHEIIRNNVIYRCTRDFSFGIYFDIDEMYSVIENNLVFQCPNVPRPRMGAAFILNENAANVVRNNIFALSDRMWWFHRSYGGTRVTGNIFLFGPHPEPGGDPRRSNDFYNGGAPLMDHNLYWSTAGREVIEQFLTSWRPTGFDRNSVAADPRFADPAGLDFRLRPGSPALQLGFKPFVTPAYPH